MMLSPVENYMVWFDDEIYHIVITGTSFVDENGLLRFKVGSVIHDEIIGVNSITSARIVQFIIY